MGDGIGELFVIHFSSVFEMISDSFLSEWHQMRDGDLLSEKGGELLVGETLEWLIPRLAAATYQTGLDTGIYPRSDDTGDGAGLRAHALPNVKAQTRAGERAAGRMKNG